MKCNNYNYVAYFFDALTSPKNMSYYSPNRSFFHGPDNISHVISCSRQPTQRSKFQHRFVNLPGRIGKWARTIWKYQPYPTHILIRFLCNHEFTKEKKQHKSWSGEYTDAILTRLSAEMSTSESTPLSLQCPSGIGTMSDYARGKQKLFTILRTTGLCRKILRNAS